MVRFLKRGYGDDQPGSGGDEDEAGEYASEPQAESQTLGGAGPASDGSISAPERAPQVGNAFGRSSVVGPRNRPRDGTAGEGQRAEMKMMRDKFAKLLLGEDMSGSGKGVSSAMALSNAITNLAAFIFADQRRLEPLPADKRTKWTKEIGWILSVAEHIVEMVPSKQKSKDGCTMEVMRTQQRKDLELNIPLLSKLDEMILDCLEDFKEHRDFWYVSSDSDDSENGGAARTDDKWWLPTVKVPPDGLSDVCRRWLQFQKESIHQVLKTAMAVNSQVLMEMEVPESYFDSLPKNGRSSLGEAMYKNITDGVFDPEEFLDSVDLSSEHKIVDLKNRIEASVVIWRKKLHEKEYCSKSSWGSAISLEKREELEVRAETVLLLIKHRFPGTPQSALDISKIQHNRDVGLSILESYSRILESLAFTMMSRIDDVLTADSHAQNPSTKSRVRKLSREHELGPQSMIDFVSPDSDTDTQKDSGDMLKRRPDVMANNISYLEKVEHAGGTKSPTARH